MEAPLFWTQNYGDIHSGQNQLLKISKPQMNEDVIFCYNVSGSSLISPGIGTFGGFYTEQNDVDWDEQWLRLLEVFPNVDSFSVVFPPEYFYSSVFLPQLSSCLSLFSPTVVVDYNQHINVSNRSNIDMSHGNKKKLRQFREAGGLVLRGSLAELDRVIQILEESRRNIGVELSLSHGKIHKSFLSLPNQYKAYVATIKGEAVAAAVTVELSQHALYVLYWGDRGGVYRQFSPVVAICDFLISECLETGHTILDLGVSSLNGVRNEGLIRFKSNLGACQTNRTRVAFKRITQ